MLNCIWDLKGWGVRKENHELTRTTQLWKRQNRHNSWRLIALIFPLPPPSVAFPGLFCNEPLLSEKRCHCFKGEMSASVIRAPLYLRSPPLVKHRLGRLVVFILGQQKKSVMHNYPSKGNRGTNSICLPSSLIVWRTRKEAVAAAA